MAPKAWRDLVLCVPLFPYSPTGAALASSLFLHRTCIAHPRAFALAVPFRGNSSPMYRCDTLSHILQVFVHMSPPQRSLPRPSYLNHNPPTHIPLTSYSSPQFYFLPQHICHLNCYVFFFLTLFTGPVHPLLFSLPFTPPSPRIKHQEDWVSVFSQPYPQNQDRV